MTHTTVELEKVDLKFPRSSGLLSSIKSVFGKKKEGFTALKNINLKVNSGEVIGVIGRNGSGKALYFVLSPEFIQRMKGPAKFEARYLYYLDLELDFQGILRAERMLYCTVVSWGTLSIQWKITCLK